MVSAGGHPDGSLRAMAHCSNCGAHVDEDARSCPSCHAVLDDNVADGVRGQVLVFVVMLVILVGAVALGLVLRA